MQRKIIFISGWGTNEKVWLPVKKKWQNFLGKNDRCDYFSWTSFVEKKIASDKDCDKNYHKDLGKDFSVLASDEVEDEIVLVGWSLGGMIALALNDFGLANVSKMILFSTSARMLKDQDYEGVSPVTFRAMMKKLSPQREVLMKDFFGDCCASTQSDLVDFFYRQSLSFSTQQLLEGLEYLRCFDERKSLSRQKPKTLIFHGLSDAIIPPAQAEYLKEKMPDATIKYMSAGHDLLFSHGDEVAVVVENFLCETT